MSEFLDFKEQRSGRDVLVRKDQITVVSTVVVPTDLGPDEIGIVIQLEDGTRYVTDAYDIHSMRDALGVPDSTS